MGQQSQLLQPMTGYETSLYSQLWWVRNKNEVEKSKRKQSRKTDTWTQRNEYRYTESCEKPMNLFQLMWLQGNL